MLGLTIITGIVLLLCGLFGFLEQQTLNTIIFFFGLGVPLILLMADTFLDLNNIYVFRIWLTIGILAFATMLMTYGSDRFKIERSAQFDKLSGINAFIGQYWTSSLKALLVFLCMYWGLNEWSKNRRGVFLINTYKQKSWRHDVTGRKITAFDVIANIILFITIIAASLVGF